uniref:Uncharacterized protein n=1 Tax=Rhizophora mucronata TaxID=61149 RepID=A0A2P2N0K9_RHIMU
MDSGTQLRAVDRGTGLEDEREDEGVESQGERGLYVVKQSKRLLVAASVYVRR